MTEQTPLQAGSNMDDTVEKIFNALLNGASFAEITGMTPETLEQMYTLALGLYKSRNYKDAKTVFRALCLYNGKDYRFWMGLGGSQQASDEFEDAINSYQYAYIAENMANPIPIYHAALCLTKLNRQDDAIVALETLLETADKANPLYRDCCLRATALLSVLNKPTKAP